MYRSISNRPRWRIRRARDADLSAIAALIRLTGDEPHELAQEPAMSGGAALWTRAGMDGAAAAALSARRFCRDHACLIELQGEIAGGFIGYELAARIDGVALGSLPDYLRPARPLAQMPADAFYVNTLATLPDHRGLGLGAELIDHAEREARARQLHCLALEVDRSKTQALGFYLRLGFSTPHGDRPFNGFVLLERPLYYAWQRVRREGDGAWRRTHSTSR